MNRPFLKWAGGKYNLLNILLKHFPEGERFVEPFVGSGAVFLNTDYKKYLLADANADLINVFKLIKKDGKKFIEYCQPLFSGEHNNEERFYQHRTNFNKTDDLQLKAALFIYLNRHGYNGLCRYNSSGEFNVPFGEYVKPILPIERIGHFQKKARTAQFKHQSFIKTMQQAKAGDVVYCDPPYVPLSKTARFTAYSVLKFTEKEQIQLAQEAERLQKQGIPVIISNHDTPFTREIYAKAHIESFSAARLISSNVKNRKAVKELIAVF